MLTYFDELTGTWGDARDLILFTMAPGELAAVGEERVSIEYVADAARSVHSYSRIVE